MKTPTPTTRTSLTTTASHTARWFAGLIAGTAALAPLVSTAGTWTGATSTDWNTASNWSGGLGGNAIINLSTGSIATISANFTTTPTQMILGSVSGTTGRVDHLSGTATVSAGNDVGIGRAGATGIYNLANTGGTGGTLTGFAKGSGSLTVPDQLLIGGSPLLVGAATGNLSIHTSGTLAVGNQLLVGNSSVGSPGGNGTIKMDDGTLTVANDFVIGNSPATTGSVFSMSNGTVTKTGGGTAVTIGGGLATPGGTGTANLNGGTFTTPGVFRVGHGDGSVGTLNLAGTNLTVGGEFWIGNQTGASGTMTFSSGSLTVNNWSLIGRKDDANVGVGATGSVTMSGGTWTKTGESNFIVGDTGAGTMTMTGGLVQVMPHATANRGVTWIGNRNSCTGTLTIEGSAEFRTPSFVLAVEGGTTGTLNLNGGTVRTSSITGGAGSSAVTFNGTTVIATGNSDAFLDLLLTADIGANGMIVDTAGFNLTAIQPLGGAGNVTKSGAGTLKLAGTNTYTGNHAVNGGKLILSAASAASGDTTVANGAGLGVINDFGSDTLTQNNVTFGTSGATTLDIDLGDVSGNPSTASMNVSGALTLNGAVTVNVQDLDPALGTFPLLTYPVPKLGGGNFVQGTLPLGVSGSIVDDDNGTVSMVVDAIKFPVWNGSENAIWDTTSLNWQDAVTNVALAYENGLPVIFGDLAPADKTSITLSTTVTPGSVQFNAFTNAYTLSGPGKISGPTGLIQSGFTDLTINSANDFTGPVVLEGGTTFINSVSNAGTPASLGIGTTPIVLNGANLNYTGPNATTDRGLSILLPGTIVTTANNLTITAPVTATTGSLVKEGAGTLTLSGAGQNVLGNNAGNVLVHAGTLTLGGGTHMVTGELWVADQPDVSANLALNNTSLTTTNWIAIGRGNGDTGVVNLTATNSTINSVNFSTGFNNGLSNNASEAFVTLNNTTWTNNGNTYLAESDGSQATMTLNGSSQYNVNNVFLLARLGSSQATFTMNGTSSVTKTGGAHSSIGTEGNAVMNVNDNTTFTALAGDFNVGDVGASNSTLNINGSGAVNVTQVYIGKNGGTAGTLNQAGGTFQSGSFITIGSGGGSNGTVNQTAGSMTASTVVNVGAVGTGILHVGGTVTANGDGVLVGSAAGGIGTLNLNAGGTVVAKRVAATGGVGTVNFNGGTLRAGSGANATFLGPIDTATLQAGGGTIDTNGQTLNVTANLGGTGGLTKAGNGTLALTGTYGYTGNTMVSAGTLTLNAATLSNTANVSIASGAVLNLTHGAVDQVNALILNGVSQPVGTYTSSTPGGYITGTGSIQVTGGTVSPFATWMSGFPSIPVADRDPGDDPDNDGATNAVEFALGGTPNNGSSRPKVFSIVADSDFDSPDTLKELLVTIAVRTGTGTFSGPTSKSAPSDDPAYGYTVQGSPNLTTFGETVNVVPTAVPPAGVTLPAGYQWRTFSLNGSNGVAGKGFLRVLVTP